MVALNENFALENPALGSKNRVGDFFGQEAKSSRVNRPATRKRIGEKQPVVTIIASGRPVWPNRDPIEERGGLNLYGMVANNPVNLVDFDGRWFGWIPILGTIESAMKVALGRYPGMHADDYSEPCSSDRCDTVYACERIIDSEQTQFVGAFALPSIVRYAADIGLAILGTRFWPAFVVGAVDGIATTVVNVWGSNKMAAAAAAKRSNCTRSKCRGGAF